MSGQTFGSLEAAKAGNCRAAQISSLLHGVAFLELALFAWLYLHTWVALPFLIAISGLLFWEHHTDDLNLAFFKLNAVLGFVVLGLVWAGIAV